jgi:hypothetical protein
MKEKKRKQKKIFQKIQIRKKNGCKMIKIQSVKRKKIIRKTYFLKKINYNFITTSKNN